MDPSTNVEFFTGAKDFNIRNGRFRTIEGDSYTNCYPPSVSPIRERPPISSMKTSFFSNSSNFEIDGGEFSAINGDSVDFSPPFDVPAPRLNDGYNDPYFNGSVPQAIDPQLGLKRHRQDQPEDIRQTMTVSDYISAAAEAAQKTDNMAPPGVDITQVINDVNESSSSPPGIIHLENTSQCNTSQTQTSQATNLPADVVVQPAHVISMISHRVVPTQSDSSRLVPVDESILVANTQSGENVLHPIQPYSHSDDADRPNAPPRVLSVHLDVDENEVHSPEEIGTSETDPPSRSRRLLNWIKNTVTTLWHRLPFVTGSNGTRA